MSEGFRFHPKKQSKVSHSVSKAPPIQTEQSWHMVKPSRLDHSPFELSMRSVKLRKPVDFKYVELRRQRARRLKRLLSLIPEEIIAA